eukprot:SAG31_NODE_3115_length_4659_cov_2.837939_3_plen_82_part_00
MVFQCTQEYSAQISAQQQGEPTEDEIWESLPPEASITQTGSSIDNSDEYDEDAELAAYAWQTLRLSKIFLRPYSKCFAFLS